MTTPNNSADLLPDKLRKALKALDADFYRDLKARRKANASQPKRIVDWVVRRDPNGLDWAWRNPERDDSD